MTDALAIDFPADDFEEKLDPAIYVQSKDSDAAPEDRRQGVWVLMMRRTARACRVIAVPNGAKRTRWEAAKARREGMATGEPDIAVTWDGAPTARIEWKNGREMPNPGQVAVLNWYHRRGHPVAVCRTAEGAMRWLASLGAPVPVILP